MKRIVWLGIVSASLAAAAACTDLFDTVVQCTTDRDCQKFGATCDVSHGVCVDRGASTGGDASSPPPPPIDADLEDATPPPPECNIPNKPVVDVVAGLTGGDTDLATSVTLDCTKDWRLGGRIFVKTGVTLTIQAGTTIRAAAGAGLVIAPGGKIMAQGQRNAPIVFTSDAATPAPGDWTGLYVLGNAPPGGGTIDGDAKLAYGGNDANDASGLLAFVRIEYGAYGLALGGVGKGTLIEYVQARKTTNNAFTFYGGTVDAKHLVAQYPGDEGFEIDNGYAGRLQFLYAALMPKGSGDHHAFLTDNAAPVVYNVTLCNDSKADPNYALVFRNNSKLDMSNAILTGFFGGIDAINPGTPTPLELHGSIAFNNTGNPAYVEDPDSGGLAQLVDDDNGFDEIAWFNTAAWKNATTDPKLAACTDPATPAPWPMTGSLTTNARTPPADGFFDTNATYIGAFKDNTDTWMNGAWVRFSSQ